MMSELEPVHVQRCSVAGKVREGNLATENFCNDKNCSRCYKNMCTLVLDMSDRMTNRVVLLLTAMAFA